MAMMFIDKILNHSTGTTIKLASPNGNMDVESSKEVPLQGYSIPWANSGDLTIITPKANVKFYITHFSGTGNDYFCTINGATGATTSKIGLGVQGLGATTVCHLHYSEDEKSNGTLNWEIRQGDGISVEDLKAAGEILLQVAEIAVTMHSPA
jgi:hypothetical protein